MALNFPSSPTVGQVYTDSVSGFSYEWNGNVWISFSAASSSQIKVIDDISGSFNGVTLSFALTTSGFTLNIANAASLRISLGGVIQSPGVDYSVSGTNIVFTTAPESGLSFSGISLGPAIPVTIIPEGTATVGSFIVSTGLSATNLYVAGVSTFVGLATHTGTIFGNNISLTGIVTATSFVGTASTASFATTSFGLSGTPNLNVGTITGGAATFTNLTVNGTQTIINTTSLEITDKNIGIGSTSSPTDALADGAGLTIYGTTNKTLTYNNTKKAFETNIPWAPNETRVVTGAEKVFRTSGNTVNLAYNSSSANVGYTTNPSGDITLNVTGIPTSSDFDDHSITFAVIVNNTGTARTCTAVNLNGVSKPIRFAGGSLSAALSGVTTTTGHTIFSFTGINTVGSASTTANYEVLGIVSGGFF